MKRAADHKLMEDSALSEAELLRVRKAFDAVPFIHFLGVEMESVMRGSAVLRLGVSDQLRQNNGIMHGGAIASLIDTAAAFAILTILESGQTTTTVDLTIHYLRPVINGQAIAKARVVRAGRRIIVASVDVSDESETIMATALTTYIRLI